MTELQKKLVTALATSAILISTVTPAFATTLTVTGNGSNSDSNIDVNTSNNVDVNQSNDADIDNNIKVDASTGNNDANDNTGGDVEIETGDADVAVEVSNMANKNVAQVDNCCMNDLKAEIGGNGTGSDNDIDVDFDNDVDVDQDNDADFDNDIWVDANTGHNDADDNTGGNVRIGTGNASATVGVFNAANYNSAVVGGGDEDGGKVSARILGNGSYTDNEIDLDFDNDVDVDQDNDADFDNDLWVDASTGFNDAEDNTGGDVEIETGDADVTVGVDNMANFNYADLDGCGCVEDLKAEVSGNGTHSDNKIDYDADSDLDVDQDNDADFDTDLDADIETGDNDADDNTGAYEGESDPSISTGDAGADVSVHSGGNVNLYGVDEAHDFLEDLDVEFSFDLDDLLGWLSNHVG